MISKTADAAAYIPVAKTKDVKPGQIKGVRARGGYELAIANVNGRYYAFDAYCPHQRWPLKWGELDGEAGSATLTCALHLWCFDLETGAALDPPLADCLQTYPVRLEGDIIHVGLYRR
ncbi:MAG: Rieske (2Fe-2S) protein [Chloroflexota bacterium]